jgi:hypothetical protein
MPGLYRPPAKAQVGISVMTQQTQLDAEGFNQTEMYTAFKGDTNAGKKTQNYLTSNQSNIPEVSTMIMYCHPRVGV